MSVLRVADCDFASLVDLLQRLRLKVELLVAGLEIPGSYWGDSEAGLIGDRLFVRVDTPLHSVLHEASHYACMDAVRRAQLHRDAGGDDAEENAVCYLQILLAEHLPPLNRIRMMQDMDAWGYSFRLGSARAWFEHDACDTPQWLIARGVLDAGSCITWNLRHIAS